VFGEPEASIDVRTGTQSADLKADVYREAGILLTRQDQIVFRFVSLEHSATN
jgi:hypothetical protein